MSADSDAGVFVGFPLEISLPSANVRGAEIGGWMVKGSNRRAVTALIAVLTVVAVAGVVVSMTTAAGAAVTNYTASTIDEPVNIAAGPDSALWFTNYLGNSIGRISTGGTISDFPDASISDPRDLAEGSDGAMWFTNFGNDSIGRISTAGVVSNFTAASISFPSGIAAGPDGALWFTSYNNDSIGRISTAGVVSSFTDPSIVLPYDIVAGSDGALWFTNYGNGSIGRISTAGVVTNFADPSISNPFDIAAGPDGALWFTNNGNGSIGRISTAGVVSNVTDPSISNPIGLASGPDGGLWFTNSGNSSIGRIGVAGAITNDADSSISTPYGIAAGPDGALWFTNLGSGGSVGRITTDTLCGSECVPTTTAPTTTVPTTVPPISDVVVARPGVPASSKSGPPTDARPTEQIITLPKQPGAKPVSVTLRSIDPGSNLSAPDRLLCPTRGDKCSGQISVFAGDFSKYVNKKYPIQARIIAKWKTKVPPGKIVMAKDAGGPPVQLARCVVRAGKYNTPCANPELVSGSSAKHNLTTTDTIYFVGTDPRFARHVVKGPDAPTAVTATAGKASAVVRWKPPVVTNGTITGYAITPHLRKVAQRPVSFPGTALTGTVTGLRKGKSYTFTIIAKTARGVSLASKASNAIKPT